MPITYNNSDAAGPAGPQIAEEGLTANRGAGAVTPEKSGEPAGGPEPEAPGVEEPELEAAPAPRDNATISASQILLDRPDVLKAFYETYYGPGNDRDSTAWQDRVGAATPEAYAIYWYDRHGKYEGYNQGPTTAGDNVSLEQILIDRPDVLRAFYENYYGPNNDRDSDAWARRVGGETPEDYARYWYEKYGRWEGYAQTDKQAAENIDVQRLLAERPDVFRAFYEGYYGPDNDRKSSAWVDRVGGDTVEDYAKYWYVTYGQREGYTQAPPAPEPAPEPSGPSEPSEPPMDADTATELLTGGGSFTSADLFG